MTIRALLFSLLSHCGQILARLITASLENNRRFDKIDQELKDQAFQAGLYFESLRRGQLEAADELERILAEIEPLPLASVTITTNLEGQITEGAMKMQLKDTQDFAFRFDPRDARKNVANIDPSKTTMQLDNPGLGTLTPDADGLGGSFSSLLTGKTQMQFSLTDAVNAGDTQTGALDIEVLPGDMATVVVSTSAPTDQNPATPPAAKQ